MSAIAAANAPAYTAGSSLPTKAYSSATDAGGTSSTILQQQSVAASDSSDANNAASVVVTLSSAAKAASASSASSSAAKAASASSASGQLDFATVADNARATLDAGYQQLGKTPDMYMTYDDWKTASGGMDRRSLYAVASNEGGQFSKMEQGAAQGLMTEQLSAAMGLTNGTFQSDPAAGFKAGVAFLDSVSPEEKAGSFEWAQNRAGEQYNYELVMRGNGEQPQDLDSTDPVVKMLKSAMDALEALNDPSKKLEDMPQYQQAQNYFNASTASANVASSASASAVDKTV
jgi:hypothetical protein